MRGSVRGKLLALFAALLASLVVLEVALRVRQYQKYGTTARSYYRFAEDPASGLTIPEPDSVVGAIRVNALGFRGGAVARPKPPEVIRLGFLGGSTTFCAEASSEAATWPELVLAGLRERYPDQRFDGVNAAVGGYSTRESQINLEQRLAPLAPDVLIVYHGTNDLTQDSREAALEAGLEIAEAREESALGEVWLTWFLVEKNLRAMRARRDEERDERLTLDPASLTTSFEERLRTLLKTGQEAGCVTFVGTFCHRARPEQTPDEQREACSSSLYYMPWFDTGQILRGLQAYNETVRAVAAELGISVFDMEGTIPADGRHFNDSVHLLDPGLDLFAKRVLETIVLDSGFQALLEQRAQLR